jgi:NADPH:quinone reductase-like Zn-dependent oxidoreductase
VERRHVIGLLSQKPQDGGFQLYTAAPAVSTAIIPSKISYMEATVLPLAVDTAAVGLYGLRYVRYTLRTAQRILLPALPLSEILLAERRASLVYHIRRSAPLQLARQF